MSIVTDLLRKELKLDSVLNEEVLLRFEIPNNLKSPDSIPGSYVGGPSLGVLVLFHASYASYSTSSRRQFTTQLLYTNTINKWTSSIPTELQRCLTREQTERMWSLVSSIGENILEPNEEIALFDILFNKPIPETVQLQLELT